MSLEALTIYDKNLIKRVSIYAKGLGLDVEEIKKSKHKYRDNDQRKLLSRILKENLFGEFIENFFRPFPNPNKIIENLSKYKELEGVVELTDHTIWISVERDPKASSIVAEAVGQDEVLETIKKYQGMTGIDIIANTIARRACQNLEPGRARKIALVLGKDEVFETIKKYQGLEGCNEIVRKIAEDAYFYPNEAKQVALALGQDEVLETIKKYQGMTRIDIIANTIAKNGHTKERVKDISLILRQEDVFEAITNPKTKETQEYLLNGIREVSRYSLEIFRMGVETLIQYRGKKELKTLIDDIFKNTDPKSVKEVIEKYER